MRIQSFAAFCALSVFAGASAFGATNAIMSGTEAVTFGPVDSVDGVDDPDNVTATHTFAGGFTATSFSWDGTISPVEPATWGSEVAVSITAPGGAPGGFAAGGLGGPGATYDAGTPIAGSIGVAGIDPVGEWSFQFFETFDDVAGSPDSTVDTITFTLAGFIDSSISESLGTLPGGIIVSSTGEFAASDLVDTYTFSLPTAGTLDIMTLADAGGMLGLDADTEIGLFDGAGSLIGFDDDGAGVGLFSALGESTGDSPIRMLAAGDYTLAVTSFDGNFEDLGVGGDIGALTGGATLGDYGVSLSFTPIPEPSAGLLVFVSLGLLARRRR